MSQRCEICERKIWWKPYHVMEPEDAPEPRRTWDLCKPCLEHLKYELRRSALYTPQRVRVAMGMVAAERSPHGYTTEWREYMRNRFLILLIAVVLFIAMILHLLLILLVALWKG